MDSPSDTMMMANSADSNGTQAVVMMPLLSCMTTIIISYCKQYCPFLLTLFLSLCSQSHKNCTRQILLKTSLIRGSRLSCAGMRVSPPTGSDEFKVKPKWLTVSTHKCSDVSLYHHFGLLQYKAFIDGVCHIKVLHAIYRHILHVFYQR